MVGAHARQECGKQLTRCPSLAGVVQSRGREDRGAGPCWSASALPGREQAGPEASSTGRPVGRQRAGVHLVMPSADFDRGVGVEPEPGSPGLNAGRLSGRGKPAVSGALENSHQRSKPVNLAHARHSPPVSCSSPSGASTS